ncbi:MAG: hypothetical protein U9R56_02865 [candidate division Zixibacteria bacterium]|nr:hypothetical protein [candidate division Zixibacteria bacterium]
MKKQRWLETGNLMKLTVGFALVALLTGIIALTGCEDEPEVFDVYDYDELIRHITYSNEGKELFRTVNLIPDDPYIKPSDPEAVYRDFVDSVNRWFYVTTTPDSVVKDHGAPFWLTDDAEVVVCDEFFIHTERTYGDSTSYEYQSRKLERIAYFLRLGDFNQRFSGWIMHAYNGGTPRGEALLEISREDDTVFRGDELAMQPFTYDKYTTVRYIDEQGQADIRVDTVLRAESQFRYILLQDIARVDKGDILIFNSSDVDAQSQYQLLAAETDSGATLHLMHRFESDQYIDTVRTPDINNRLWEIVLLQEFTTTGHLGSMWCVPYRIQ